LPLLVENKPDARGHSWEQPLPNQSRRADAIALDGNLRAGRLHTQRSEESRPSSADRLARWVPPELVIWVATADLGTGEDGEWVRKDDVS
jgi:hypothetical protein